VWTSVPRLKRAPSSLPSGERTAGSASSGRDGVSGRDGAGSTGASARAQGGSSAAPPEIVSVM
jgi:hypothetical protein